MPAEFAVPSELAMTNFTLRMLSVNDVEKDFEAVTSSNERLSKVWPDSGWPAGLTLKQNLVDLGWHEKEFQNRTSFAYTMVAPDESRRWAAFTFTRLTKPNTTPRCFYGCGKAKWRTNLMRSYSTQYNAG